MRKRFISQPKPSVDSRKAPKVTINPNPEKSSNRPRTVGLQAENINLWLTKNLTIQNISSPKIYSPFNKPLKKSNPSIIELLLAKHKNSNEKLKAGELMRKTVKRPVSILTPKVETNQGIKTPDYIRVIEEKVARESTKSSLVLSKSNSSEILDNFVLGNELGKGAYATVRSAHNKENNSKVAIKVYDKLKLLSPSKKKNAEREIKILSRLNHPNIIKLYKTVENKRTLNLIMEYVGGCSLLAFLKKKVSKRLDESEAKKIFKQIIQALEYCHSLNITHRDIKLENILIGPSYSVKIIDFGFSTCFSNDKKVKLFCGTPSYMSPEIVSKQESFGPPSDIWAAGVVLYILLTGTYPFKALHSKELYLKIQRGTFVIPQFISNEASSLISAMLSVDPLRRPQAKMILDYS